jgi:hypothetical protein
MKKTTKFKYQKSHHSVFEVFSLKKPLEQDKSIDISLANHTAISAVKNGKGIEDDLHTLAFSVNMSLILAEMGHGTEFIEEIKESQFAMFRTIQRFKKIQKVGFSGEDMLAIQEIIGLVDEQIAIAPKEQILKAIDEIKRRQKIRAVIH